MVSCAICRSTRLRSAIGEIAIRRIPKLLLTLNIQALFFFARSQSTAFALPSMDCFVLLLEAPEHTILHAHAYAMFAFLHPLLS